MTSPTRAGDSWAIRISAGLAGDARYAARRLWKERGFTATALLTLALCIGANTAIFSMVYALVLKPLPFHAPTRIVEIYNNFPKAGLNRFPCNLVQYSDFKANTSAFESIALFDTNTVMLGETGSAERIHGADCTAEVFDVLGIQPIIGQFFTLKNCRPGEDKVIVLTESLWKARFNEDPGVLDKPVRLDGETYRIVAVAPQAFEAFNTQARFIRPISWKPDAVVPQMRYACYQELYARLKPGVPLSRGLAEVAGLEKHFYDTADPFFKSFLDRTGHRGLSRPSASSPSRPPSTSCRAASCSSC